jgi:hypothetical protein
MRSCSRVIALALVCLGSATVVGAQDQPDSSEAGRFRLGPLRFTPSLVLSNLGMDDNVFNATEGARRDTTAALGPAVDLWLHLGRSRISGKTSGQYLYFKDYDNQRSWNTDLQGRWEVPLSRVTPFIKGGQTNTRDRPGYEIDSRVRLKTTAAGFGSEIRLTNKTSLVLTAQRTDLTFDDHDALLGSSLADRLNRQSALEQLQVRLRLTPLTTFVIKGDGVQDRFDTDELRNANSVSVQPGFELRPQALISGSAYAGFRRFHLLRGDVPDYRGIVANVSTKYEIAATQVALTIARDVVYSYEVMQPYYALTDLGISVTERVTGTWDLVGRTGWQAMGYRNTTALGRTSRTDHGRQIGAGVGYRVGRTLRLGFDVNHYQRMSPTYTREFRGLRFGGSVSYGLPQ